MNTINDIKEKNPWNSKEVKNWKTLLDDKSFEFILEKDKNIIEKYNKTAPSEKKIITKDVLPEPFIGNPEAQTWTIMLNPGYAATDKYIYKYKKLSERQLDDLVDKIKTGRGCKSLKSLSQNDNEAKMNARREMYFKQLSLSNSKNPFYIINENFDIWENNGNAILSAYAWWGKALTLKTKSPSITEEEAHKNYFNLELFPYHSQSFGWHKTFENLEHTKFVKELIEYAIGKKKTLIFRKGALKIAKKLNITGLEKYIERTKKVYTFKSQNCSINSITLA